MEKKEPIYPITWIILGVAFLFIVWAIVSTQEALPPIIFEFLVNGTVGATIGIVFFGIKIIWDFFHKKEKPVINAFKKESQEVAEVKDKKHKPMKQFFKTVLIWVNKYKVILLLIMMALGLFYWLQLRPAQIREHCFDSTIKSIRESDGLNYADHYDLLYKLCLQRNGLER